MAENPFRWHMGVSQPLQRPRPSKSFDELQLGYGQIVIDDGPEMLLTGTIGYAADGWSLKFHGSRSYGSPSQVRFQGKGVSRRCGVDLRLYRLAGAGMAFEH